MPACTRLSWSLWATELVPLGGLLGEAPGDALLDRGSLLPGLAFLLWPLLGDAGLAFLLVGDTNLGTCPLAAPSAR